MDNEYEILWNEFKNRIALAKEYSIRQDLAIDHIIELIVVYEKHFIKPKDVNAEIKEELGFDPINSHSPQDVATDEAE